MILSEFGDCRYGRVFLEGHRIGHIDSKPYLVFDSTQEIRIDASCQHT